MTKRVSRCQTTPEPLWNHLRNQVVPESLIAPLGAKGSEPDGWNLSREKRKSTDDRNTARRVYRERVAAGEVLRPRRVKPSAETKAAIALYRVEVRRKKRRDAKLIAEAKRQLEREDELRRITHKGGRPRKVVHA